MALVLQRKPHERITIGPDITVTVVEVHGNRVRLSIVAPREVPVHRGEVYDAIHGKGPETPTQPLPGESEASWCNRAGV